MSAYDDYEETGSTRLQLTTGFMAYLRAIFSQPLLSPELERMACWLTLAAGNLAAAQSLNEVIVEVSAHDTSA